MPSDPRLRRWGIFAVGAIAALALLRLANRVFPPPRHLGAANGRLAECPASPNCVCSQSASADATHAIDPFPYDAADTSTAGARTRMKELLARTRGAALAEEGERYLRYEFTTPVCGFRDDVEFLFEESARVIHVRSASRIGYSDLGANRRRLEALRARWLKGTEGAAPQ